MVIGNVSLMLNKLYLSIQIISLGYWKKIYYKSVNNCNCYNTYTKCGEKVLRKNNILLNIIHKGRKRITPTFEVVSAVHIEHV